MNRAAHQAADDPRYPTEALLYPEKLFGGYSHFDGGIRFYTRVNALLARSSIVLDYGCGRGFHKDLYTGYSKQLQVIRGKVQKVIGVDVDLAAQANPYIDEFKLIRNGKLLLDDGSIDICLCEWVLEHIMNVDLFFSECRRVLTPGGFLCIRTPNLLHYSSIGASLVPFGYHSALRRWLGYSHTEADVFPTFYRCNTMMNCRRTLRRFGFSPIVYAHRGESHLINCGLLLARVGKVIESLSPSFLWHELHAFGKRLAVPDHDQQRV